MTRDTKLGRLQLRYQQILDNLNNLPSNDPYLIERRILYKKNLKQLKKSIHLATIGRVSLSNHAKQRYVERCGPIGELKIPIEVRERMAKFGDGVYRINEKAVGRVKNHIIVTIYNINSQDR